MDYCNELKRITDELFDGNDKVLGLLSKLSNIGVIAGGSIVFALNSFVPKETVGDIDVFVNNKDDVMRCIDLIYDYFPHSFDNLVYEFDDNINLVDKTYSIVNIKIFEKCVPIQIILKKFISPKRLLKEFDIDYVQCAIHNNKLNITKDCIKSHKERKIFKIRTSIRYRSLLKATLKGFKCIVFERKCNKDILYSFKPIEVSKTVEQLENLNWSFFNNIQYFSKDQQISPFVFTDSAIIKTVEIVKKERRDENDNIINIRYKTITYLTFETTDNIQIDIQINFFSYYVNIQKINNESREIIIEDDLFLTKNRLIVDTLYLIRNNLTINNCWYKLLGKEEVSAIKKWVPAGENILFICPYYENLESQDLNGAIGNIEDLNENILPIYAAYNYEVIGHKFEVESKSYSRLLNIKSCKK